MRMRPRSDEYEDETSHLLVAGHSGAWDHPWDLHREDAQELANELEERLARKRRPGFAPWPEEQP